MPNQRPILRRKQAIYRKRRNAICFENFDYLTSHSAIISKDINKEANDLCQSIKCYAYNENLERNNFKSMKCRRCLFASYLYCSKCNLCSLCK